MHDPSRHYRVVDRFFEGAASLRRAFEGAFSERLPPFDPRRFVWERWHVEGQFRQQRAPARLFFAAEPMAAFEARLLSWASVELGLSALGGPPWLSYLIDGDFQGIHRDTPNGVFAFSYGLSSPRGARFRGGETVLARPELLDYWRLGAHAEQVSHTPLFDEIPSRYDRLVVFDSRLPHAVSPVEGPRDARAGRVAIQGWLVPNGCVARGVPEVDELAGSVIRRAARACRGTDGLLTLSVAVGRGGAAGRVDVLVDTLVATGGDAAAPERASSALRSLWGLARFPRPRGPGGGRVIVPVLIRAGDPRVVSASEYSPAP